MAREMAVNKDLVRRGQALALAWASALAVLLAVSPNSFSQEAPGRPPRAHSSIDAARECYLRGDYENADKYLQHAQRNPQSLTVAEQKDLNMLVKQNATALQQRRDGALNLHSAEEALRQGRIGEANNFYKKAASANQYLHAGDKQRLAAVGERLRVNGGSAALTGQTKPYTGAPLPPVPEDYRSLVTAARAAVQRGDLDHAEAYARHAEKLGGGPLAWVQPWRDTPASVLRDVQAARLKQAAAIQEQNRGATAPAVQPAPKEEKVSPLMVPFHTVKKLFTGGSNNPPKVDPPARVEDPARIQQTAGQNNRPPMPPMPQGNMTKDGVQVVAGPAAKDRQQKSGPDAARQPGAIQAPPDAAELCMLLVKEGKLALTRNDVITARSCAEEVRELRRELVKAWWAKEQLEQVDRYITEVESRTGPLPSMLAQSGAAAKAAGNTGRPGEKVEGRALLKAGRKCFQDGNLDEAEQICAQAAALKMRWGLFQDSPDRLRSDILNARTRKDKAESVRVLTEARKLFGQGNYEEARKLAYQAKQLHGPYSVWDLSDRPDKLLAEIQTAEAKQKRNPGMGGTKDGFKQGQPLDNTQFAGNSGKGPMQHAAVHHVQAKQRAQALLVETRELQKQGMLIEARAKALEAHRWAQDAAKGGVLFTRDEDSPDLALMNLSSVCAGHVQLLTRKAEESILQRPNDPKRFETAHKLLEHAHVLAGAYGLDVGPIHAKVAWVRQMAGAPVSDVASNVLQAGGAKAGPEAQAAQKRQQGFELLEKARLELKCGQLNMARKLAEEAFLPVYGVQEEAVAFLRSLDIEEFNRRCLDTNRTFDAGHEAFLHHDYKRAAAIFAALDERLLSPDRQVRLRELSAMPQMQTGVAQAAARSPAGGLQDPGRASVSDTQVVGPKAGQVGEGDQMDRFKGMQEVVFQMMRNDGIKAQQQAMERAKAGDHDGAIDLLRSYLAKLEDSNLAPERVALLSQSVTRRMGEYKTLKAQKEFEQQQTTDLSGGTKRERQRNLDKLKKNDKLQELVEQANAFMDEGKFNQAEVAYLQALEFDSDNLAARAGLFQAQIKAQLHRNKEDRDQQSEFLLKGLRHRLGPYADIDQPMRFADDHAKLMDRRKGVGSMYRIDTLNPREKEIERRLQQPITLNIKEAPLSEIGGILQEYSGVNVFLDRAALEESNIKLDMPMSLKVEGISLKSALNLLLKYANLTYVIEHEVLQITTPERARGNVKTVTYSVADLVTPVNNHPLPESSNIHAILDRHLAPNYFNPGVSAYTPPLGLNGGQPVSNSFGHGGTPANALGGASGHGGPQPPKPDGKTIEDLLIHLITHAIAPDSWAEMGGRGNIQYYPLGNALVVNQTQDIQEQIVELLAALRRLQDLEVAIEMRLVSVSEAFFERIGVDFDINITNRQTRWEPQLVTQQFAPPGYLNVFRPDGFISGLTPAGTFTPDLGIPLRASSFDFSLPPFGGFPGTLGADGGLSLGLAFLSDIQVFMFMEAAQGDRRTNIMQAPKITVFNGQTASITVTDNVFFLSTINVVPLGSQLAFQPVQFPFPFGVFLTVTPVVSADRRFVRLNLTPTLTNLTSATVPLLPIQQAVLPLFDDGIVGVQPQIFTIFLQQPSVSTISVNTTVVVPDGGTVLMGGLKTLAEARNEFGPPILSKIPYINRLFKNVGYGREGSSLMIMVTARIIINEEEERIFLGLDAPIPR